MKQALTLNIKGIKCDSCDYNNEDVLVEEYDQWLNKPCPECGVNLLTEADYNNVKVLMNLASVMNGIFPSPKEDEEIITGSIEMNGTGEMNIKLKD